MISCLGKERNMGLTELASVSEIAYELELRKGGKERNWEEQRLLMNS